MTDSLREQGWRFICATFPERQIYIRSDGRVQFFTFGPLMQAILAGISLLFLGWVAFTSVNVIFKDRIIASKESHFRQMQSSYETRIADLQVSYDELNTSLVAAHDRFETAADQFESKHEILASLLGRKQQLQAMLGIRPQIRVETPVAAGNAPIEASPAPALRDEHAMPPTLAGETDGGAAAHAVPEPGATIAPPSAAGGAVMPLTPDRIQPDPRTARPQRQTLLNGAVQRLGALFKRHQTASVEHPELEKIVALADRVARLDSTQHLLLEATRENLDSEAGRLKEAMRIAGLNPQSLMSRATSNRNAGSTKSLGMMPGIGGPLLPLPISFLGNDGAFDAMTTKAVASLDGLASVVAVLRAVPLAEPVSGAQFEKTSGFGGRFDPFTKRLAFHAGLDFGGPHGSPVRTTAPGTVVFAGYRGGYGNTVEIDHGFGIKTRYGHLAAISVRNGTKLEKGAVVGKLGSTGRSTGPHVHYEVWFDDAVRNPSKFLKAGQYVLKEQRS